jgi:hypothetical protein
MCSVTVVTKLAGTESSFATRNTESLHRLFRTMQDEKLRTPAKASHRLFINIYTYSDQAAGRKIKTD